MSEERLFDLKQIAEALGVTYEAARKRADRGLRRKAESPWPIHSTATRQGQPTRRYAEALLPPDVRAALDRWGRERSLAAMNAQTAAEEDARRRDLESRLAETIAATEARAAAAAGEARRKLKAEGQARFTQLAKDSPKYQRAKAREWLVLRCWQIQREERLPATAARAALCERVNDETLAVPPFVSAWLPTRHGCRGLRGGTLHRWVLNYQQGGIWALTDGYGNREGQGLIDATPALLRLVLGAMAKAPQISGAQILAFLRAQRAELAALGVDKLPTTRSIQSFKRAWIGANGQLWTFLTHPDRWKNVYMAAAGSHFERIDTLNQVWELDSTPGDWLLTDGRHAVIGGIDLYSRRLMFYVSRSSRALAVGQLFRRMVLAWGVPAGVRTDNGKDYVSDYFDAVLRDLEVKHEVCIPFASEEKGTIERGLQTMSHGVLALLPGFIGHNVAEREAIRGRKSFAERVMTPGEVVEVDMTAAELQGHLDDWAEHAYAHDPHGGLAGRSPWETANAWTGPVRRIENERALDALLAEVVGVRTVRKKGLRFDNHFFFSPAVYEHMDQPVRLKRDESDLGRLYVYTDRDFVGVAECPALLGISAQEAATVAKKHQRKALTAKAAELRAATKEIKENIGELVLRDRAQAAAKLAELPRPATTHDTTALRAAAQAAEACDPAPLRRDSPEEQARKAALDVIDAVVGGGAVIPPPRPESDRARFSRWRGVAAEAKRGEHDNNPELLRQLQIYIESAEWQQMTLMAEDFPEHYGLDAQGQG